MIAPERPKTIRQAKHVTLIEPPQVFTKTQVTAGVVPPMGIMYLTSHLNRHNIDVKLIDSVGNRHEQYTPYKDITLRGSTFEQVLEEIPPHTDLIGITSLYTSAHLVLRDLVEAIKKKFPAKPIALGGAHPSALCEFVLTDTVADLVVLGEGEATVLEVCQNLGDYSNVQGIAYRKEGGKVHFTPCRSFVPDINELAFPDRSQIKMENYFQAAEPHGCSASQRWTTLLSSRGCPYICTFCPTPQIWKRSWRARTVQNVIEEMVELNKKYGVTDFHFEDENMALNKKWMHEFCDTLIKRKLKFTWQPSNGLRVETVLSPGLMQKMKDSGCSLIVFTMESANHRVREEIIKKKLDGANVEKAINLARKVGIKTTCYFILGLPGETLKEAKETTQYASFLARFGLDECVMSLFAMIPGSELFNRNMKEGRIKLDNNFFERLLAMGDLNITDTWTEHITGKELLRLRSTGYAMFHINKIIFHPLEVLRTISNIFRGVDELKSERVLRTYLKRFSFFNFVKQKSV
jgi:anaerobic magnesium-protoporphyrin IX monomethyl ester cyclase